MSVWRSVEQVTAPAEREIQVWRIALEQPAALQQSARDLLSADERARAARYAHERDAGSFALVRSALRLILGAYLATPARELRFAYTARGKPQLAWPRSELAFNLCHAGAFALLACKARGNVGVDIEQVQQFALTGLRELACSPDEARTLAALPEALRSRAFLLAWTRKEAYLKARGEGVADQLRQISVVLDPAKPAALLEDRRDPEAPSRWSLVHLEVSAQYIGALACDELCPLITTLRAETEFLQTLLRRQQCA
jgi:4'-phosphopantetheinyl transferase